MIYDTVIIGGGVVGLSILRSSLQAGYNAILLERNPHLCNEASGRNSGVICTGVDAPSGSLERALIRDSISRVREFCAEHNVPMRECGSLVCLWPWDEHDNIITDDEDEKKIDDDNTLVTKPGSPDDKLERVLQESLIAGDNATLLSSKSVLNLEPSLSSHCRGAVHIPGEIVVDPWLFPLALATHARELGKQSIHGQNIDVIQTGREVVMDSSSFNTEEGIWNLVTRRCEKDSEDVVFQTKSIINSVGVNSDLMQKSASSVVRNINPPTFAARPRRGQYIVYSAPQNEFPTRPIQPVPTDRTKGIFVYSTLYNQIVVGPTAKDQSSRTDDEIERSVAKELAAHATRVFDRTMGSSIIQSDTDFDPTIVGEYVGIRPGTSKRDYQIQLHCHANFITVGGIRSTGLSASLGIGRHVVQSLLCSIVSRSEKESTSVQQASPTPLPDVESLVEQYHSRGDGTVNVAGHDYRVTHPLTRMGWDARTGIASSGK
mmetsp:Transcript_30050/g.46556  ORF Transcript_30050/g.46556 Transcript_30050/m.46556 type:complete len:489 (+) Transcript_30050:77-1543(+)